MKRAKYSIGEYYNYDDIKSFMEKIEQFVRNI